jgi:hypothetical protein
VVRPVGLTSEDENEQFLVEARQGDAISGKISRAEVAQVVAHALRTPSATGARLQTPSWLLLCTFQLGFKPSLACQGVQRCVAGAFVGIRSPHKSSCVCDPYLFTHSGKTFEVRRSEARDSRGRGMSERAWQQLFLGLSLDRHRARVGLFPFPKAVPPPPPPSEDRTKVHHLV